MAKDIKVGYTRVSTEDQNSARQLVGLELDRLYAEVASGKNPNRPELQRLLADADLLGSLKAVLYVHSMDRLARNVDDLRRVVKELTGKGMAVQFLKEGLTFTGEDSPMAQLLLTLLGAVAEFERSLILERQKEGIAEARKLGVYTGRKPALDAKQIRALRDRATQEKNKSKLAREFGVSRETVRKVLLEPEPA